MTITAGPLIVGLVDVGATSQEQLHHREVSLLTCHDEGRSFIVGGVVEVGAP